MLIETQAPPVESLRALQDTAETMPQVYGQVTELLREICARPTQHWPHPVYVVGLNALASEHEGLRGARLTGWRFLTKTKGARNHAVEVQQTPDGDDHRFAELDKGPFIDGMCRVLEDKNFAQQTDVAALKLSVLRVNAMGVFALWLRANEPERELIIPIAPTPPCLKPWPATYTVPQFQAALREEARRELEAEDDV